MAWENWGMIVEVNQIEQYCHSLTWRGCDQAMHWNPPPPPPPHPTTQTFNCQYLSHFSTDSAEILLDCSLGGEDQVYRVKTVTLQHCSIPCSAAEYLNTLGLYLSYFSTDWAENFHDCSLGGKDQVYRVKTLTLQHCSIPCSAAESLNTLCLTSQPFLNVFSWNFCMIAL